MDCKKLVESQILGTILDSDVTLAPETKYFASFKINSISRFV